MIVLNNCSVPQQSEFGWMTCESEWRGAGPHDPTATRTAGFGATLSPERVPVRDCFALAAVARCRTQDFPILILRLSAVRIFCRAHVDPERRAAPSGRSFPCEGIGNDEGYGARDGTGFGTILFALPYSHEGPLTI